MSQALDSSKGGTAGINRSSKGSSTLPPQQRQNKIQRKRKTKQVDEDEARARLLIKQIQGGNGEAARGFALLSGRPTVGFEDVHAVSPAVLNHRLILNYKARFDQVDVYEVIDSLLAELDEAGLNLPKKIEVQQEEQ